MAGTEGLLCIHVPFSVANLSHISAHGGSFDADPFTFVKQLKFVFQSYNLTYKDIHIILTSTFPLPERPSFGRQLSKAADEQHELDHDNPIGVTTVPNAVPHGDYQHNAEGPKHTACTLDCILTDLCKISCNQLNYHNICKLTQRDNENPAIFMTCLTEAFIKPADIKPDSSEGVILLNSHFTSEAAPLMALKPHKISF